MLNIEIVPAGTVLASRAATVRARTNLKLPDAFALATALDAEHGGSGPVELSTFDRAVRQAHDQL